MERDRITSLLVEAAADGAVDFAKADPFDAWWWKRTGWVLSELLRKRNLRYLEVEIALARTALGNPEMTKDGGYESIFDKCYARLQDIYGKCFPWLSTENRDDLARTAAEKMAEQWMAVYGAEGLSEEAIDAQLAAMHAQHSDTQEA